MALSLKLSRTGINKTGTEMYLSDVTGIYSEDNPGGYGTPNPSREQLALVFQAIYHPSTGDEFLEIIPYDPETVENITIQTNKDGYIEVVVAAVPKTVPTVEGEYGYQSGNIVQLVGGSLVPKTPLELLADPLYTQVTSFKTVLLARIAIYRNRANLDLVKLKQAKADDRSHNRVIADKEAEFNFVRGLLEGARYQWCLDSYISAQLIVESFNELIQQDV